MSLKTMAQGLAKSLRHETQLIVTEFNEVFKRLDDLEEKAELDIEKAIDEKLDARIEALKAELTGTAAPAAPEAAETSKKTDEVIDAEEGFKKTVAAGADKLAEAQKADADPKKDTKKK